MCAPQRPNAISSYGSNPSEFHQITATAHTGGCHLVCIRFLRGLWVSIEIGILPNLFSIDETTPLFPTSTKNSPRDERTSDSELSSVLDIEVPPADPRPQIEVDGPIPPPTLVDDNDDPQLVDPSPIRAQRDTENVIQSREREREKAGIDSAFG